MIAIWPARPLNTALNFAGAYLWKTGLILCPRRPNLIKPPYTHWLADRRPFEDSGDDWQLTLGTRTWMSSTCSPKLSFLCSVYIFLLSDAVFQRCGGWRLTVGRLQNDTAVAHVDFWLIHHEFPCLHGCRFETKIAGAPKFDLRRGRKTKSFPRHERVSKYS